MAFTEAALIGGYNSQDKKSVNVRLALVSYLVEAAVRVSAAKEIVYINHADTRDRGDLPFREFANLVKTKRIHALNGRDENELGNVDAKAIIFIDTGHDYPGVVNLFTQHPILRDLLRSSPYLIGDAAGAVVAGAKMRSGKEGSEIVNGLAILPDTIIEPHFDTKNRRELLKAERLTCSQAYGIGIDEVTALIVDPWAFPQQLNRIGEGNVTLVSDWATNIL